MPSLSGRAQAMINRPLSLTSFLQFHFKSLINKDIPDFYEVSDWAGRKA